MKDLLFCYKYEKKLRVRHTMLTDVFVPVQDIVSPQKTTLTLPKTDKIELSDIIIIKDNNSGKIEYIGYIDTITTKSKTEISCYPLINAFDNDFVLDQIFEKEAKTDEDGNPITDEDGKTEYNMLDIDVVGWLSKQLERAFIDTEDSLQALPLKIRTFNRQPVFYQRVLETANLLEAYLDLFINTGVYIVFSGLEYNENEITGIYCDIYANKEQKAYNLRYDNPKVQSVEIVDNTFSSYNKIIATEELAEGEEREPTRFFFYLLNDNSITTNPNDDRRIKQVRSKEITFSLDVEGEDEDETLTEEEKNARRAEALMLAVYNELQAPEYNLQITIEMFKNDNLTLYRRVEFTSDKTYYDNGIMRNVVYTSNITKIERLNDLQVRITLGALRNSLTDFKKKVEKI